MADYIKKKLADYQSQGPGDGIVKLLRAFLIYLPDNGNKNLIDDIKSCETHQDLYHLTQFRLMTLLFPMYTQPRTPFVVTPRGNKYPITLYGELEMEDEEGYKRLMQLQNACRSCDGLRCSLAVMPDCEQTCHDSKHKGILKCSTRVVHIIPSGLAGPHSGLFWETPERYLPSLNLSPEDIDSPRNAITMDISLQYLFRTGLVSLEAIEEHSYRIRDRDPSIVSSRYLPGSGKVNFVNYDSRYELPSPVLLEIHAVIARILHMTRKDREIDGDEKVEQNRDIGRGW